MRRQTPVRPLCQPVALGVAGGLRAGKPTAVA